MITKEEVIEIYKRNGRDTIHPNVAAALAESMRLVASRMMEALAVQGKRHDQDIETLATNILQIVQSIDKAEREPHQVQRAGVRVVCYCGTPVNDAKCGVCGRAS